MTAALPGRLGLRESAWASAGLLLGLLLIAAPVHAGFDHSHASLDQALKRHVRAGKVHYGDLAKDRAELDAYVSSLAELSAKEAGDFTPAQAKAFWINAYNALTLKLILDRRPKQSIRDIDSPWDGPRFEVAGRQVTLNDIEHKILRPRYKDPRLHAVLVCAARSCPILESRAYTAGALEHRLNRANKRFARDTRRNRVDAGSKSLQVSRIFDWYGDDYIERYATAGGGADKEAAVRGFLATELGRPAGAFDDYAVSYLDYDWSLNGSW